MGAEREFHVGEILEGGRQVARELSPYRKSGDLFGGNFTEEYQIIYKTTVTDKLRLTRDSCFSYAASRKICLDVAAIFKITCRSRGEQSSRSAFTSESIAVASAGFHPSKRVSTVTPSAEASLIKVEMLAFFFPRSMLLTYGTDSSAP